MYKYLVNANVLADILSVSKATVEKWERRGELKASEVSNNGCHYYNLENLKHFNKVIQVMLDTDWDQEIMTKPIKKYRTVELFAGAGGLALGLEKSGFIPILLNEIDHDSCLTLKNNRSKWNVVEGDISELFFKEYKGKVDLLSGGFPCQAFSYAGSKRGFDDTRGTLFYEFARAIREIEPKVFLAENVRGLMSHDKGRTLETIKMVINECGYTLIEPKVLKAIFYRVPQKRERLFLVGIRKDLIRKAKFKWPSPYKRVFTLRDALYAGELFESDAPISEGQQYNKRKKEIMDLVPPGGYWRDLPEELQKEYMKYSFYLGGGKTGMARRLSLDEPSLTLTCAPAQKQTERCHPIETRPLTVREYARVQTFPDDWLFCGNITSQYKQIGNAVPVNLAYAVGLSLIRLLNSIENNKANHEEIYGEGIYNQLSLDECNIANMV